MRNGKETTIRSAYAFNHNFMGRMRLMILDAQTSQQLQRYKRGELDLDRSLAPKRKMQLDGNLPANNNSHLLANDKTLSATPSDIEQRKIFEFERYKRLRVEHKLTRGMRDFGEKKEQEQEIRDNESRKVAKL